MPAKPMQKGAVSRRYPTAIAPATGTRDEMSTFASLMPTKAPIETPCVTSSTAAFLTRMTKISTGHASPTAGAASAMLLILLIQVIGDSVTRSA